MKRILSLLAMVAIAMACQTTVVAKPATTACDVTMMTCSVGKNCVYLDNMVPSPSDGALHAPPRVQFTQQVGFVANHHNATAFGGNAVYTVAREKVAIVTQTAK